MLLPSKTVHVLEPPLPIPDMSVMLPSNLHLQRAILNRPFPLSLSPGALPYVEVQWSDITEHPDFSSAADPIAGSAPAVSANSASRSHVLDASTRLAALVSQQRFADISAASVATDYAASLTALIAAANSASSTSPTSSPGPDPASGPRLSLMEARALAAAADRALGLVRATREQLAVLAYRGLLRADAPYDRLSAGLAELSFGVGADGTDGALTATAYAFPWPHRGRTGSVVPDSAAGGGFDASSAAPNSAAAALVQAIEPQDMAHLPALLAPLASALSCSPTTDVAAPADAGGSPASAATTVSGQLNSSLPAVVVLPSMSHGASATQHSLADRWARAADTPGNSHGHRGGHGSVLGGPATSSAPPFSSTDAALRSLDPLLALAAGCAAYAPADALWLARALADGSMTPADLADPDPVSALHPEPGQEQAVATAAAAVASALRFALALEAARAGRRALTEGADPSTGATASAAPLKLAAPEAAGFLPGSDALERWLTAAVHRPHVAAAASAFSRDTRLGAGAAAPSLLARLLRAKPRQPGWWQHTLGPHTQQSTPGVSAGAAGVDTQASADRHTGVAVQLQPAIDTTAYRIVCPAPLGNPYGATSPLTPSAGSALAALASTCSAAASTRAGGPTLPLQFGSSFPLIAPGDQALAHALLLRHLGLAVQQQQQQQQGAAEASTAGGSRGREQQAEDAGCAELPALLSVPLLPDTLPTGLQPPPMLPRSHIAPATRAAPPASVLLAPHTAYGGDGARWVVFAPAPLHALPATSTGGGGTDATTRSAWVPLASTLPLLPAGGDVQIARALSLSPCTSLGSCAAPATSARSAAGAQSAETAHAEVDTRSAAAPGLAATGAGEWRFPRPPSALLQQFLGMRALPPAYAHEAGLALAPEGAAPATGPPHGLVAAVAVHALAAVTSDASFFSTMPVSQTSLTSLQPTPPPHKLVLERVALLLSLLPLPHHHIAAVAAAASASVSVAAPAASAPSAPAQCPAPELPAHAADWAASAGTHAYADRVRTLESDAAVVTGTSHDWLGRVRARARSSSFSSFSAADGGAAGPDDTLATGHTTATGGAGSPSGHGPPKSRTAAVHTHAHDVPHTHRHARAHAPADAEPASTWSSEYGRIAARVPAHLLTGLRAATAPGGCSRAAGVGGHSLGSDATCGRAAAAVRDVPPAPATGGLFGLVGASMGGMQALSLASLVPGLFRRVLVICTTGKTSPSTAALRYVQRTALRQALSSGAPPATALDAARLVGMLAYRTRGEFDARFEWGANADAVFECEGYMHQAAVRFRGVYDVHCYLAMSKLMDLMDLDALARGWDDHERHDGHGHLHEHDYENPHAQNHNNRGHGTENGRGHGPAASTGRRLRLWGSHRLLASSPQTELYMIGIKEDALIPVTEMGALAEELGPRFARRMQFDTVTSQHGHDAFLTQPSAFRNQISHFLDAGVASGTEEVRRYCKSVDA